ncbi:hypothetical protein GUITHDRAFT_108440 [Guillardia theta CCMP2712]|uniref:Uncharacterized protein n=2 Tax=Guillardia theta TaxID=55529 RepID=L1JB62_GUITC|nr:hypothetical protein GUITHDRAFT_108440 [Guillardia theta CCMP2712]EKX45567.1 hypothetical protein GUITHDRAFT_108440 [Guillardia theta CCMP2712]|eukprot:XP_005832547.1 hypothetical protein GUITHDRAFT_108440 [Guillardia theta CCMP2712]
MQGRAYDKVLMAAPARVSSSSNPDSCTIFNPSHPFSVATSSSADGRAKEEGNGTTIAPPLIEILDASKRQRPIYPYIPGASNAEDYVNYVHRKVGIHVKQTSCTRIISMMRFLQDMLAEGTVQFVTSNDESQVSVFGFTVMTATQPEFNHKVKDFISSNPYWVRLNGRETIKRPTQQVYELFRQLGIVPVRGTRGLQEKDEDKRDFLLATTYQFSRIKLIRARDRLRPNGISYLQNYRLLSVGPEDMNAFHDDVESIASVAPDSSECSEHGDGVSNQNGPLLSPVQPRQTSQWHALMGLLEGSKNDLLHDCNHNPASNSESSPLDNHGQS